MLVDLPIFGFDGDILRLTALADDIMDDALVHALKNNALLSPLTEPPPDWTQIRTGGLPGDHWARVALIVSIIQPSKMQCVTQLAGVV